MKKRDQWIGIAGLLLAVVFITAHQADANWGFQTPGTHNPQVAPPSNGLPAAGVAPRAHYVIHGGYVAAGVGMRDSGFGSITIGGIPAKSKVVRAFLYWDVLADGLDPSLAVARFKGKLIVGDYIGEGGDPCWGSGGNFAFRADVTKLVAGNGTYNLAGFTSFYTDGGDPWDTMGPDWPPTDPMAEGATLVVFYFNKTSPVTDMVLVEGTDEFFGNHDVTVDGFLAADPATKATVTLFGGDGQTPGDCGSGNVASGEETDFNGTPVSFSDWDGADGPNELWDTHTHDVSGLISPGDTSAIISKRGHSCDCLVWVGAIVAVSAADTDGDGLPDAWEKNGYTDPDNMKFVDLPGMGAKFDHKDLFVEIDYMVAGDHTHKPLAAGISKIIKAFKKAPVLNPDGTMGVNLHVDTGQGGLFNGGEALAHQTVLGGVISNDWASAFDVIKMAHFASEREHIFHYLIFAHDIDALGTSGISRGIPGRDFVVSLGHWTNQVGTVQEQAGTFMHELGHNINLHHGGGDDSNYKPNFLSIMNYSFQTRGLRKNKKDGTFDYSRFLLPALDEFHLNENIGLNGGAAINAYGTIFYCGLLPGQPQRVVNKANGKIDWDCDGGLFEASVPADTNKDGFGSTLPGFEDWDNLDFRGITPAFDPPGVTPTPQVVRELSHELTVEEDSHRQPSPPADAIQHGNSIAWTPVGLEIITAYKIYKVGPHGGATLVMTVPSSATTEELDRAAAIVPGGKGVRYAITSLDRYGNESELSVVSGGK